MRYTFALYLIERYLISQRINQTVHLQTIYIRNHFLYGVFHDI